MASVNKVILLGHLGRDPEVRYLPSGVAVTQVSIATSSRRKDKTSGQTIEETQWHRVKFFDRLAEIAGEYLKKGKPVYIEGRLQYGKFEKDGVTHYTTDIVATELQMLGGRDDAGEGQQQHSSAPAPRAAPPARPPAPAPAPRPTGGSGFDDMDDDIPF